MHVCAQITSIFSKHKQHRKKAQSTEQPTNNNPFDAFASTLAEDPLQ